MSERAVCVCVGGVTSAKRRRMSAVTISCVARGSTTWQTSCTILDEPTKSFAQTAQLPHTVHVAHAYSSAYSRLSITRVGAPARRAAPADRADTVERPCRASGTRREG
jgi:hypothetical protein